MTYPADIDGVKRVVSPAAMAHTRTIDLTDTDTVAAAFVTVLQQALVEVFALQPEESLWVGWQLSDIFAPLATIPAHVVPMAVRTELLDGTYSRMVSTVETGDRAQFAVGKDGSVTAGSKEDWVAIVMDAVRRCYDIRATTQALMAGQVGAVLTHLGVGHPVHPRGSVMLPNELRDRLSTAPRG